jgi:hypothetical protein
MDANAAAPPKQRKRRWFQFSLRTLFVVVTLMAVVCGYIAQQYKIVGEREEMWNHLTCSYEGYEREINGLPWLRRQFGDRDWRAIWVPEATREEQERIKSLFPEAVANFDRVPPEWTDTFHKLKDYIPPTK